MRIHRLHTWNLSPKEAVTLQRGLADRVVADSPPPRCTLIAGADVSYNKFSPTIFAGVVVLRLPDLTVVERRGASVECHFPYIPGLLSFREAPALLAAFAKVKASPNAVMLDGQGFAHPRRLGLACHIGLWLDRPCFGCAKSLFVGKFDEPDRQAGACSPLTDKGAVLGRVVRTKTGVKPVFVSVGHRMNLDAAVELTLACRGGYRIPEPTRRAHLFVNELRRGEAAI
ncbi:MAG TPA: deoxyribonuclease V [Gemmataceae bacterium]|nr:deoxyribonuclease V [Gemmataceae bacterium]